MKKTLWKQCLRIGLMGMLCVSLVACGGDEDDGEIILDEAADTAEAEEGSEAGRDTLKFIMTAEPDSIDPTLAADSASPYIISNCFEGLTVMLEDGSVMPGTAESWEVSEDGLVYTFHLRENAVWSDGKDLTSADFVYAWKRLLSPEVAADYEWFMGPYVLNGDKFFAEECNFDEVGIKAPDGDTIVVTLEHPCDYFLELCATPAYSPVREDIVEGNPSWSTNPETYITNGPFCISQIAIGEGITLVKNDHYWDADNVALSSVEYDFVADVTTALQAYEKGEVDGMDKVPGTEYSRLKLEDDGFQARDKIQTIFLNYNVTDPVLSDVRIRKALSLAIDRDAIVNEINNGVGKPAYDLVAPGISVDGQDFREYVGESDYASMTYEERCDEARKLLAEAGYPDGNGFPELEFQDYNSKLPTAIIKMWEDQLGISTITLNTVEWKVHIAEMKKLDIQIARGGWTADFLSPTSFLSMYIANSGNNYTGWKDSEYDALIAKAETESGTQAMDDFAIAEEVFMDAQPIIPLYYNEFTFLMNNHLKGWYMTANGYLSLKGAYFE
ncbi:MAG: peptide ABC transporter substrate-binding protein [Eubacteriales bacterium]|nr:peptide ABC transporter substrate-binding protein [Eubacteriales bacterium]